MADTKPELQLAPDLPEDPAAAILDKLPEPSQVEIDAAITAAPEPLPALRIAARLQFIAQAGRSLQVLREEREAAEEIKDAEWLGRIRHVAAQQIKLRKWARAELARLGHPQE